MEETQKELKAEEAIQKLDKIGLNLAQSRSEAIRGRADSGIEDEWLEDEEYYEGVDDASRNEVKSWRSKPLGQPSPTDEDDEEPGSTIFLNITRPYVDAVAARIADMLLQSGERGFSIRKTPIPELIQNANGAITPEQRRNILTENPDNPEAQDQALKDTVDQAQQELNQAKEAAKKVEDQIWDWQVECQYATHNRRVIEDTSKVGSGVIKGPIPTRKVKKIFKDGELQQAEAIKPASTRIYYRNFYPDPACGENIHDGNYTWEKDDITRSKLKKLIGTPGYIKHQVQKCLKEGSMEATKEFKEDDDIPGLQKSTESRKHMFEIWYYYGSMRLADLMLLDIFSGKHDEDYEGEYVNVHVVMVNNRVIKAVVSHLETGEFPYDIMIMQRRVGMPWGIGTARQVRPAQRIINGAVRHMMDNAGVAGGPMCFIDETLVQPEDGINEIRPWKMFVPSDKYREEHDGMGAKDAVQFIEVPMVQQQLQAIIEMGLKLAEDMTGLPQIMQGQINQRTPDTLGGMQMQFNNASTVLRRIAKLHDDLVTTPHVRRYYEYILEHSEDDTLKGEFAIHALGSSTLVERDIADQAIIQLGNFVQDLKFGIDPAKWMKEMLAVNKLDPARFEYDDEEWQRIVEQMSQPPADPKLEIAQIQTQNSQQLAAMKIEFDMQAMQFKAQQNERIIKIQKQLDAIEKDKDRRAESAIKQFEKDIDVYMKELSEKGSSDRNLADIKQKLQSDVMKLKVQMQLSGTEAISPPVEPKGRAPDGQSFQK